MTQAVVSIKPKILFCKSRSLESALGLIRNGISSETSEPSLRLPFDVVIKKIYKFKCIHLPIIHSANSIFYFLSRFSADLMTVVLGVLV